VIRPALRLALFLAAVALLAVWLSGCAHLTPPPPRAPAVPCTVSTDIQEFKEKFADQIQRACGDHIKSVEITGTNASVTYAITYDREMSKTPPKETVKLALLTAMRTNEILQGIYPSLVFVWSARDLNGVEIYRFTFTRVAEKRAS
jgi:hypothetical protein